MPSADGGLLRVRSSSKKSVCANALACALGHVLARTEARTVPLRLSMATRRLPSVAFVTPASITYARASFQEPQLRERASAQSWKTATSACCQAYLGQAQAQGRQGVLQPDLGKEACGVCQRLRLSGFGQQVSPWRTVSAASPRSSAATWRLWGEKEGTSGCSALAAARLTPCPSAP